MTKKILRFYFGADSLESAFDNLINAKALALESDTFETADRLCGIIGDKIALEGLWAYLDGIISALSKAERDVLLRYSARRNAPKDKNERRDANRVIIKFTRRARRLGEFEEAITLIKKYYCLIAVTV